MTYLQIQRASQAELQRRLAWLDRIYGDYGQLASGDYSQVDSAREEARLIRIELARRTGCCTQ